MDTQLGMKRTTTSSLVPFQPFQPGRNKFRHDLTGTRESLSTDDWYSDDLWSFIVMARNFELTKTTRESFLAANDCCLAHPTPSYIPSGVPLMFAGSSCL